MDKKEVLKETGCVKRFTLSAIIALVGLAITIMCFKFFNSVSAPLIIIGALSAAAFFTFAILSIKEIPIINKINRAQYTVKQLPILSIKFRHPYAAGEDTQRSLEFSKFKLTVDKDMAKQLKVGDEMIMVFLKDITYPIIIKKKVEMDIGS